MFHNSNPRKPQRHPSSAERSFPTFGGRRLTPSRQALDKLLRYHGVELLSDSLDRLWEYHQLLRSNNEDQDLTRLNAFETIVERHYADCLIINAFEPDWPDTMLDVGSGAGFPGIPFKLANPHVHIVLCEPRPKRVAFLELVIRELHLQGIEVFPHKVTSKSMKHPAGGAIMRAFAAISDTLPRLESSIAKGGSAWFMKGPAVRQELADARLVGGYPGWQVAREHYYTIPNSDQQRSLVVMTRL